MEYLADIAIPKENWTAFGQHELEYFISHSVATEPEFGRKMSSFRDLLIDFYVIRDAPNNPGHSFYIQRYVDVNSFPSDSKQNLLFSCSATSSS